jgi:hypothetical protein
MWIPRTPQRFRKNRLQWFEMTTTRRMGLLLREEVNPRLYPIQSISHSTAAHDHLKMTEFSSIQPVMEVEHWMRGVCWWISFQADFLKRLGASQYFPEPEQKVRYTPDPWHDQMAKVNEELCQGKKTRARNI